ncbi:hypothetical protein RF11_08666 [Thelohanellus kitauei]|uniref:FLYWCH-type domain-containing protein n=1 Tax=Thelohanellus kitauei TaxID=669202 RepID=A0A0C2J342_THEKT|nr:hypothetical protein RF11_08666 [Thelohanellus kitauei]
MTVVTAEQLAEITSTQSQKIVASKLKVDIISRWNMNFVYSARGKKKIVHEGYVYYYEKSSSNGKKIFWKCDQRTTEKCNARIHTCAETHKIIKCMHNHTHGSDPARVELLKLRGTVRNLAMQSDEPPSKIIQDAIQLSPSNVLVGLHPIDSLKRMISRKRSSKPTRKSFKSLEEVELPEEYRKYKQPENEDFLLIDTGSDDPGRILVFGRKSNTDHLQDLNQIFIDGNFHDAPVPFHRIYVIMAKRHSSIIPLFYILLPNSHPFTIHKLFDVLCEKWPWFKPYCVSVDFEHDIRYVISSHFPTAKLDGCFFHFTKILKKKLDENGLIKRYNNETEFSLWVRMIAALAFVPKVSLETAISALLSKLPPDLHEMMNWFACTFLNFTTLINDHQVLYPPDTWSVHDRITSPNSVYFQVENLHKRMMGHLSTASKNLFKLIEKFKNIQSETDREFTEAQNTNLDLNRRTSVSKSEDRISKLVDSFKESNMVEFLRGIAFNVLID